MSDSMQKVVAHLTYSGFSIHDDTVRWMRERGCPLAEEFTLPGETYSDGSVRDDDFRDCVYPYDDNVRVCEHLIAAVEQGIEPGLDVVEVPEDIDWIIDEYDGWESIREKHRVFPSGNYATGHVSSEDIDEVCTFDPDQEADDD